jgi:galactokinase
MFRAPGRVNLIGEHVDYVGGLVLPVAIDRFITVDGKRADTIRLASTTFGSVELAPDGSGSATGWGRFVAAVACELAALGRRPVGFAGTVEADLPAGVGLGSSAALEVAVASALCAVADFELDPLTLARACQRAELRAVGVPCGIMDQAAALLARAGHALLLDCTTLAYEHVKLPEELAVLVFDSGFHRRLEESGFARLRERIERGDPHVEAENARVLAVVNALRTGDLQALREPFEESHESLRRLGASTPELDRLVSLAHDEGAIAARMTGGGFGGCVVALAEKASADALAAAVIERCGRGRYFLCRTSAV